MGGSRNRSPQRERSHLNKAKLLEIQEQKKIKVLGTLGQGWEKRCSSPGSCGAAHLHPSDSRVAFIYDFSHPGS